MSSWTPTTYKTRNWAEYNLSLKQRGSLSIWFDPEMVWEAVPSGRRGRQQAYSDAAIQACLTLKVLFGCLCGRRQGLWRAFWNALGWTGLSRTTAPCAGDNEHCPLPSHTRAQQGHCTC